MVKREKTRIILHEIIKRLARKMARQETEYEKKISNLAVNIQAVKIPGGNRKIQKKSEIFTVFDRAASDLEKSIHNTKQKINDFKSEIQRSRIWLEKTYGRD